MTLPIPTYRSIEIFRAVMLHGGITAAADALGTSQPFISRTIGDLQNALGYPLFAKQGRTIKPTEQANALMSKVQQSFLGLEDILRFSEQMRKRRMGRLAVSTIPALGHALMAGNIEHLRSKFPNVIVSLTIASHVEVIRHVRTRQADIGFAAQGYSTGDMECVGEFTAQCVCVGSKTWLAESVEAVSVEDLAKRPFIALTGALQKRLDERLASHGIDLDIVAETSLSATASELAIGGLGIAVVDPYTGFKHRQKGGVAVPLKFDFPYRVHAMAMGDSRLSDTAKELLACMKLATRNAQMHNLQV